MISRLRRFLVPCAALVLSGCGAAPATALDRSTPLGTRVDHVELEQIPVKGHHVSVTYGPSRCIVNGELIAVTPHALIVLDEQDALWQLPVAWLTEVELELYPSRSGTFYTSTTAGSVSTLSHGYWLAISLPLWLAVGMPLANAESGASHLRTQAADAPRLATFARFPHGGSMDWSGQTQHAARCG
jgi:hypothetical protein